MNILITQYAMLTNLADWSIAKKITLMCSILSCALLLGYWFNIKSRLDALEQLRFLTSKLQQELVIKKLEVKRIPTLRSQVQNLSRELASIAFGLSDKSGLPGFLEDISKAGEVNELEFKRFKLMPEKSRGTFVELPISISVTGTFQQLISFVFQIENFNRLVVIKDFDMRRIDSSRIPDSRDEKLVLDMTLNTYYSLEKLAVSQSEQLQQVNKAMAMPRNFFQQQLVRDEKINSTSMTLQNFPITSLQLVGVIKQGQRFWALLSAPNQHVYWVGVNSPIGQRDGRVTSISDHSVEVTEMVIKENSRYENLITLKLKQ